MERYSLKIGLMLLFSGLYLILTVPLLAEESVTTAGASQIVIIYPKQGDIIPGGKNIEMIYQLTKGLKDNGDHIHIYIDGENDGTSKRSPRSLGKLPPGRHVVNVRIANMNHDPVKVEATVEFEVTAGASH